MFVVVRVDLGGGSGNGFYCNIVNVGGGDDLATHVVHPFSTRNNRIVPIQIFYGNSGNVDIPAPTKFLISLEGAPIALTPDDLSNNSAELVLIFEENGGPPGILRPGASGSFQLVTYSSHPMRFILTE